MNFKHDFGTIELILSSDFETRGVDAFCLSLLKVEKQMRKIFTYLIYQNDNFNCSHYTELRNILADNTKVYFDGFIIGINLILDKSIEDIYGTTYNKDLKLLNEYILDRNKIFHGQITKKELSREELQDRVETIKRWCETLSTNMNKEIGYDGFGRNSFQKAKVKFVINNKDKFDTLEKYKNFINDNIQRKPYIKKNKSHH